MLVKKSVRPKMVVSSVKRLFNLTKEETKVIMEELTFDNPQYHQAVKYSKNPQWVKIPPHIVFYNRGHKNNKTFLDVPIGYRPPFEREPIVEDNRVAKYTEYPNFLLELRETQSLALTKYIDDNKEDINGLIVLPTGKGKSILGLAIAHSLKQKTLIIVHKDDLVVGWKEDIKLCFNDMQGTSLGVGLIKAKSRKIGEQITIATVQTLNRMSEEEIENLSNEFGLVIIDEAHHCPATSYDLLMKFNAKYKLGLTATPERNDGTVYLMQLHFGGVCFNYKDYAPKDPKEEEDILSVKVKHREINCYCDPVYIENRGHYTMFSTPERPFNSRLITLPKDGKNYVRYSQIPYDLKPRLSNQTVEDLLLNDTNVQIRICEDIVNEYRKGSNSICFFLQKKHIDLFYSLLTTYYNVDSEMIQCYYGDSKLSSKEAMQNAESGKVRITLSTYAKGTEGTNIKALDTAFLISSLNNGKNTEQAIGRIRRVADNKRKYAVVYDYDYFNSVLLNKHFLTRNLRYKKLNFEVLK